MLMNCVYSVNPGLSDLYSFPARGDFFYLLKTFANSLDPNQA